jgi:uncharacterized membrane protein (DUF373 family)
MIMVLRKVIVTCAASVHKFPMSAGAQSAFIIVNIVTIIFVYYCYYI